MRPLQRFCGAGGLGCKMAKPTELYWGQTETTEEQDTLKWRYKFLQMFFE
jgi:hypothetical protein